MFAIADAIEPRYRALILLAVFASMRWGELAALRRADIDLSSEAGRRTVGYPELIDLDLARHLGRFAGSADDALVFTTPAGTPMGRGNFRRRVWLAVVEGAGVPAATHFHDLRHTGKTSLLRRA